MLVTKSDSRNVLGLSDVVCEILLTVIEFGPDGETTVLAAVVMATGSVVDLLLLGGVARRVDLSSAFLLKRKVELDGTPFV